MSRGFLSSERALRAFSLMELMVALSISMIVGVATLMVFNNVYRFRARLERMTIADDNAKVLGHYLEREAQRVGGTRLRPWEAIGLDDENGGGGDPACNVGGLPCVVGDRLTFAFPLPQFPPETCSIDTFSSGDMKTGTVRFKDDFEIDGKKQCCITVRSSAAGPFNVDPATLVNTHAIVSSQNKHFGFTFKRSLGDCTFQWVRSGQVRPLASGVVGDSDFDRIESDGAGGEAHVTGFGVPVEVATFFVGCVDGAECKTAHPELRALKLFSDRNASATAPGVIVVDAGDRVELITAGVIDFQVALFADVDGDGSIDEASAGNADEVFGNDAADSKFVAATGRTQWRKADGTAADLTGALRGVTFEVVTGVMTHDPAFVRAPPKQRFIQRASPVDVVGLHQRRMQVAAAFRNLNILK